MAIENDLLRLKKEAKKLWLSEDGLMKLEKNEVKQPFPGQKLRTVKNHNGILWLAYFYALLSEFHLLDDEDRREVYKTIERLEKVPGLYLRRPGGDLPNSMDNDVGIMWLSRKFDLRFHREMYRYGERHGWTFDAQAPETTNYRYFRQPIDVAVCKIANGKDPSLVQLVWLVGGFVVTAFQNPLFRTSEWLLNWLRLDILKMHKSSIPAVNMAISACDLAFYIRLKARTSGRGITAVLKKMLPGHVISSMVDRIWRNNDRQDDR